MKRIKIDLATLLVIVALAATLLWMTAMVTDASRTFDAAASAATAAMPTAPTVWAR